VLALMADPFGNGSCFLQFVGRGTTKSRGSRKRLRSRAMPTEFFICKVMHRNEACG
jgi:hypothetical protein